MPDRKSKPAKASNATKHEGFNLPSYMNNKEFQAKVDDTRQVLAQSKIKKPGITGNSY